MGASAKLKKLFWNVLFRNVPRSRCISGPLDEGVSKWEQEFLTYLSEHPKLHRVLTPASLKAWRNCISSPTQAVEGSRKGSRGRGRVPDAGTLLGSNGSMCWRGWRILRWFCLCVKTTMSALRCIRKCVNQAIRQWRICQNILLHQELRLQNVKVWGELCLLGESLVPSLASINVLCSC